MKTILQAVPIVILVLFYTSCSSHRPLYRGYSDYEHFNSSIQNKSIVLVMIDGRKIKGDTFAINAKGMVYSSDQNSSFIPVPIKEVEKIITKDQAQGAVDGMLLGAAGGAFLFMAIGSSEADNSFIKINPAAYAMGGAIIGFLPGLVLGATVGHSVNYIPSQNSSATDQSLSLPETPVIAVPVNSASYDKSGRVTIEWKGRRIKLDNSDVHRIVRTDGEVSIWISEDCFDEYFQTDQ